MSFNDHETHLDPAGSAIFDTQFDWDVTIAGSAKFTLTGEAHVGGAGSMSALYCTGALQAVPNLSQSQIDRLVSLYLPGDTNIPQIDPALVAQRSQLPWKNYYLVIGGVPGMDVSNTFVSGNTDPSETNCNTAGVQFSDPPPAGAPNSYYSSQHPLYAFFDRAGNPVTKDRKQTWYYSGPVESPPGYQDNVNESVCEEISFGALVPSGGINC